MNWQDPQHDPLDDLLQKAHWPEAQPEQLDRLQRGWQRTVRRRKVLRVVSVAAILIPIIGIAGTVALKQNRQPHEQQIVERPQEPLPTIAEQKPDAEKKSPKLVVTKPNPSETPPQIVREPDGYERAVARVHRQQILAAKVAAKQTPKSSNEIDPIAAAIKNLVEQPNLETASIARHLTARLPNAEAQLRRWLQTHLRTNNPRETSDSLASQRNAAQRLLGAIATQNSVQWLLAVLQNKDCPTEVVEAVARISTVEQLAARVRTEPSPKRQQIWLVALFERGSPQAIGEYFRLIDHPLTSSAALSAAGSAKKPPVEELLAVLQSPRISNRVAAARILGSLNKPTVSRRLIELAMNPGTRREALIGLMCSSDPVAKQFLVYAQHDLTLAASVQAINNRYSFVP
jgi:HEAT repeat protein